MKNDIKDYFDKYHVKWEELNELDPIIGDIDVISELVATAGLDVDDLRRALAGGDYLARLEQNREESLRYGVAGIPAYIINDGAHRIIGAQPIKVFRDVIQKLSSS